jgi:hypothetical protein
LKQQEPGDLSVTCSNLLVIEQIKENQNSIEKQRKSENSLLLDKRTSLELIQSQGERSILESISLNNEKG